MNRKYAAKPVPKMKIGFDDNRRLGQKMKSGFIMQVRSPWYFSSYICNFSQVERAKLKAESHGIRRTIKVRRVIYTSHLSEIIIAWLTTPFQLARS